MTVQVCSVICIFNVLQEVKAVITHSIYSVLHSLGGIQVKYMYYFDMCGMTFYKLIKLFVIPISISHYLDS